MSECLVCVVEIELVDDVIVGELLVCDDCGAELELKSLDPVVLDEAPAVEEDWGQ